MRVRMELPPAVTDVGFSDAAMLAGTPESDRFTVPAAPALTAVAIVEVTVLRRAAVSAEGVADMEKSGTIGVPMVTDIVVLWVTDPSCPFTVMT